MYQDGLDVRDLPAELKSVCTIAWLHFYINASITSVLVSLVAQVSEFVMNVLLV